MPLRRQVPDQEPDSHLRLKEIKAQICLKMEPDRQVNGLFIVQQCLWSDKTLSGLDNGS